MIRLRDNSKNPNTVTKKWHGFVFAVRRSLKRVVEIPDGEFRYRFSCENLRQYPKTSKTNCHLSKSRSQSCLETAGSSCQISSTSS